MSADAEAPIASRDAVADLVPEKQPLPRILVALYGAAAVHTLGKGLAQIAEAAGLGAKLTSALHRPDDPAEYSDALLRRSFLVWPEKAPQLPVTSSLLQHSTQLEVECLADVQSAVIAPP